MCQPVIPADTINNYKEIKMKKIIFFTLLLSLVMFFACSDDQSLGTSYVRLYNSSEETFSGRDIRLGSALFEGLNLAGKAYTEYYSITEGRYSLDTKESSNNWGGMGHLNNRCEANHHYTITIVKTTTESGWGFSFTRDD